MTITIGVAREREVGERRVAVSPETVKKLAELGAQVRIEQNAGMNANFPDAAFTNHPSVCMVADGAAAYASAELIFRVTPPSLDEIAQMPIGCSLVGLLRPFEDAARLQALNQRQITAFALELVPRISRAQSMDALSSQASCAGYQAAIVAATYVPKFFPMLTTAAGTMRPAKVLVIGAGVAGLQAIATARRLGAMVEAYDVRAAAREQVESLGAKFVDTGVSADGAGGYARELTAEEKTQQAEHLARAVAAADAVICTAAIPGKRAPIILTEDMVQGMKFGAVVVDMAAETGGNCALTLAETEAKPSADVYVFRHGVHIHGLVQLPSRMASHASELLAKNLFHFISPWLIEGQLRWDTADEVVAGSLLCHNGQVVHPLVLQWLNQA